MAILNETETTAGTEKDQEESNDNSVVVEAEKTFTQSQLEAILARKQSKWESQISEMKGQVDKLTSALSEKQESTLTTEEKLNQYKSQLQALADEKKQLIAKHRGKTVEAELIKACSKTTRPEIVAKLLRDKVQIDDNDKVFALNEYDTPMSLDELVKDFVKEYPEFVPAPKSGTGMTNGQTRIATVETKKPTFKSKFDYDEYLSKILSGQ